MLKFDHYCPFAANAIGWHNYKQYYLLLLYGAYGSFVMLSYATEPMSEFFWYKTSNVGYNLTHTYCKVMDLRFFVGFLLFIASMCIFPFCTLLLIAHSFFISKNITTKEFFTLKSADPFGEVDYNP